jgi:hypothetical protein
VLFDLKSHVKKVRLIPLQPNEFLFVFVCDLNKISTHLFKIKHNGTAWSPYGLDHGSFSPECPFCLQHRLIYSPCSNDIQLLNDLQFILIRHPNVRLQSLYFDLF